LGRTNVRERYRGIRPPGRRRRDVHHRAPGQVFALDARTGRQIWRYQRTQKVVNPYESNRVNRGVAVLGNRLFFGTLDAALVALDLRTGAPLWEVQVADTMQGYSITSAPSRSRTRS